MSQHNLKYPRKIVLIMNFVYILILFVLGFVQCYDNKYSAEANAASLKALEKPFRMQKLNLVWTKARVRLSEPKLKSLFGELKLHDKEEITWKKLRADGKDKDGMKEAELRKKFLNILNMYGLLDQAQEGQEANKYTPPKEFNEATDERINKSLFKDKKLNKLWTKAEMSGFSAIELDALKDEFNHHQDKIDQYYSLLHDVKENSKENDDNSIDLKLDRFNALEMNEEPPPKKDYLEKVNLIREKNKEIKDGFDRLHLASQGPDSKEFVEPKVQGLWKVALESKFSPDELESLRVELQHYEGRLLKLRHMQAEHALNEQKYNEKIKLTGEKSHGMRLTEDNIKKQARKVEKIHLDIESRIMQKHLEL